MTFYFPDFLGTDHIASTECNNTKSRHIYLVI